MILIKNEEVHHTYILWNQEEKIRISRFKFFLYALSNDNFIDVAKSAERGYTTLPL